MTSRAVQTSWRRAFASLLILAVVAAAFGTNTPAAVGGPAGLPVSIDSGRLSRPLVASDSHTIVYTRDASLFVSDVSGTPPVELGAFPFDGFDQPQLLADGSALVVQRRIATNGRFELVLVPLDGSAPTVLNRPFLDDTASVRFFEVAPDGQTVAYQGSHASDELLQLVVVDIASLETRVLSDDISAPENTFRTTLFEYTPDSSTVVWGGGPSESEIGLFSAAVDGTRPSTRLTPIDRTTGKAVISPNGQRVVYQSGPSGTTQSKSTLSSVPVTGGSSVLLASVETTELFTISPSSSWVVFVERRTHDVRSVPMSGGSPVLLVDVPHSGFVGYLAVGQADQRVLIQVHDSLEISQLLSAPVDGGPLQPLTDVTAIREAVLAPDGATVVFVGGVVSEFEGWHALQVVPLVGGVPVPLSPRGFDVDGMAVAPSSDAAAYWRRPGDTVVDMQVVALDGGTPAADVFAGSSLSTRVDGFFTPDSQHLLVSWSDLNREPRGLAALHIDPIPAPALLRVTTDPPLPAKITVDGATRDRWALTWLTLPPGFREVCFGDVPGWTAPECATVTTGAGTTTVQGDYQQRGWLRVTTDPPLPSAVSVDGVSRNQWGMWTDVAPGMHEVCFGAVEGFDPPACETVEVVAGSETAVTGAFTPSTAAAATGVGLLRVTTMPPVASQISVDGIERDRWSLNWLELAPGPHEVCFGEVSGWTEPDCEQVTIDEGAITAVEGRFRENTWVRVTTSPATPSTIMVNGTRLNDWGAWVDLREVSFDVCFSEVDGYRPDCQFGSTLDRFIEFEGVWPG